MQDHFLDKAQKKLTADIINKLLDVYFDTLAGHGQLLADKPQVLSDICTSILVMFTREVLTHYIMAFNFEANRKEVIKTFCDNVREQVNEKVKGHMQ